MRNMSFMLTTDQVRRREKTVTRRIGWLFLKPGDLVQAVEKGMGLKKGETVTRLAVIRVESCRREPLDSITADDCRREGFPEMTPAEFVEMFRRSHGRIEPGEPINRIEFSYVDTGRTA